MSVLTKLLSGYWHYRINTNKFIQWPQNTAPKLSDGFPNGWITENDLKAAERAVEKWTELRACLKEIDK